MSKKSTEQRTEKSITKATKKNFNNNERISVTYLDKESKEKFVVVFNELKQNYTLYEVLKESYVSLGTSTNPLKLEEKYKILEKI